MPLLNIRRLIVTTILAVPIAFAAGRSMATTPDTGTDFRKWAAESSLSGSFLAAQIAAKTNDDVAAVAFFERSLSLDPENDELKQMLFLALSANGRIDEAVELARENYLKTDSAGFARVVVAVDALKRKSFARVGEILNTPAGGDLDKLVDELLAAWAVFGNGDPAAAIEMTRHLDGPDWAATIRNYHSGLMAAASGDDAAAAEHMRAAVENRAVAGVLSETYLRAVEALVRAQARSGDVDGARSTLEDGLGLLSAHPPFLALEVEIESEKPPAPLVTTAQQGAAEIFYNVGAAISRENGAPFAQSYLQLANYLHPKADFMLMALANLFESQKSHARANEYYGEIGDTSPYYRRSRIEYSLNLNDLDDADAAEQVLRELIGEKPDDLLAYSTLGGILSQHKNYEEAAKVYDAAVEQIETSEELHWNLFYRRGIAYERIKQWDKAEPNFRKSLELSPERADVLNYLGYSWIDMGINLEEGIEMIQKAVELNPRSGYIVDSLGWAYHKLGQYEKAVDELERAVEIMPQDPVINDHLGDAYWKVGRKLEATFQWKHALAFDPELEDKIKIKHKLKNGLKAEQAATASSD